MKTICKIEAMATVRSLTIGSLLITVIAQAPMASAEVKFRGFGSIVAGQTLSASNDQTVLGYTDTIDFKRESLFALQAEADLDENLTATMQLISRGNNSYDTELEWAYVTYAIQDNLKLSAGRIRAPYYRYSDFLDVHYALNWITGPERVYAFDFPGYDGLSLLHNTSLGPIDSSLQLTYGSTDGFSGSTPLHLENQMGINWVGTWEWLTVRSSYLQANIDIDLASVDSVVSGLTTLSTGMQQVAAGFGAAGEGFSPYATAYSNAASLMLSGVDEALIKDDQGRFMGAGFSIDRNALVVDSEFTYYEADHSMVPKTTAYYLTVGWRFGPTLVYTTYSREKADAPFAVANTVSDLTSMANSLAPYAGVPQLTGLVTGATQLAYGAKGLRDTLVASEADLVNVNIGLRWDFHPSAAFKVAYEQHNDRIKDQDGSVIRAAIDLVF
ncbi:MAG: hypothetical protein U5M23_07295 [Marinagarivorans sp.]|nr:hypothetical protein [Marinagarivorans sp.]